MGLSPQQIEARRTGMTATDIAAVVGVHPHRTAVDVFLDKTGVTEPSEGNDRTKWGELLEPVIRADFAERHGARVEVSGTLAHPKERWMLATPDGLVYYGDAARPDDGLEIKCHTFYLRHEYGTPLTDEVPHHELIQCTWGMAVTSIQRWWLVPFIDGQPTDYLINRDGELVEMLTDAARRFLVDHVRAGVPPEPDGSDRYTDWLRDHWKKNRDDLEVVDGDEAMLAQLETLRLTRHQIASLEHNETLIVQALKRRIGDGAGLTWTGPDGKPRKLTWKRNKPTEARAVTNWAAVVAEARTTAQLAASATKPITDHAARVFAAVLADGKDKHIGAPGAPVAERLRISALAAALATLDEAVVALAKIDGSTHVTIIPEEPGNRPFNCPKTADWKTKSKTKEHDNG